MAVGTGDGRYHGVRDLGNENLILRIEAPPRIYSQHKETERLAVPGADQEHDDGTARRLRPRAPRDGPGNPDREIVDDLRLPRAQHRAERPRLLRLAGV